MKYKIKLTALDGKFITPRTGTHSQEGTLHNSHITESTTHKDGQHYIYWTQDCPGHSPGIVIEVNNCEKIDENTYEFLDYSQRKFRLEYVENTFTIIRGGGS